MKLAGDFGKGDWILPPPFASTWRDLSEQVSQLLSTRLCDTLPARLVKKFEITKIRVSEADFYQKALICDVQIVIAREDESGAPASSMPIISEAFELKKGDRFILSCLYADNGFTFLNGSSALIYHSNASQKLDLSDAQLRKSYTRFFCRFVHGESGPFEVLENAKGITLRDDGKRRPQIRALKERRKPGANQETFIDAYILYGTGVYKGHFSLDPSGSLRMVDDVKIAEVVDRDPPVAYLGCVRFVPKPRDAKPPSSGAAS